MRLGEIERIAMQSELERALNRKPYLNHAFEQAKPTFQQSAYKTVDNFGKALGLKTSALADGLIGRSGHFGIMDLTGFSGASEIIARDTGRGIPQGNYGDVAKGFGLLGLEVLPVGRVAKKIADPVINKGKKVVRRIKEGFTRGEPQGLLDAPQVDLSKHIGDQIIPVAWDGTQRGQKIFTINDLDIGEVGSGGNRFMDAAYNVNKGIVGASNEAISNRIDDRTQAAGLLNLLEGGSGKVLLGTNSMTSDINKKLFAEAYSGAPSFSAIKILQQGTKDNLKIFNQNFKNISSSTAGLTKSGGKGKPAILAGGETPFKNMPDVNTPEFKLILEGKMPYIAPNGKQIPAGDIRKAFYSRMTLKENEKMFNYNFTDLRDANLDDVAGKLNKGDMGNRIAIVRNPEAMKTIKNEDLLTKDIYDTSFTGETLGHLDIGAQPIEKLMPKKYALSYAILRNKYPNKSEAQLRSMVIGQLEKSGNPRIYSEKITEELVDNLYKGKSGLLGGSKERFGLLGDKKNISSVWDDPIQAITSADTSINSSKLPAAFTQLKKEGAFKKGSVNIDIGGGKFDNADELLQKSDATNLVYDPFNRTKAHNANIVDAVSGGNADTATLNNVLNVIDGEANQLKVLNQAKDAVKKDGEIFISVYQGKGDGVGRVTSKGYQQDKKVEDYLDLVRKVFPDAKLKNKIIRATNK